MKSFTTVTLGLLTTLTLTAITFITPGHAAHPGRVDVIGTAHERIAQLDSSKNGSPVMRVDIIERIDSTGPVYPYAKPMNR